MFWIKLVIWVSDEGIIILSERLSIEVNNWKDWKRPTKASNLQQPQKVCQVLILNFCFYRCISSKHLMKFFLNFARRSPHLNFITCCIGSGESNPEHYMNVWETLMGFEEAESDTGNIVHTCGCMRVGGLSAEEERPFKKRPQSTRSSIRSSAMSQNASYYSSPAG